MAFDGKAWGEEIVTIVREYVQKETKPLLARIAELEKRNADFEVTVVGELQRLETECKEFAIKATPAPQEPQEPDPEQFRQIARDIVDERLAAFPVPENGKDGAPGKDADQEAVAEIVADIITGNMRKDFEELRVAVDSMTSIPVPKDGKDGRDGVDGKDGRDGADGLNGKDGSNGIDGKDGKDGRDGLDVKELFVADGGELVAVFSDGRSKNLGKFRGEDGKPGRDGFGFDDLDVTYDGERTFTIKFARAADVKEFVFKAPIMIYRGVWTERAYETGDTVTWGGSTWHCNQPTTEKPDGASKHWTLSNKKGRDGKDGVVKTEPAKGPLKVG